MTIHDLSVRQSIWLVICGCFAFWTCVVLAIDFLMGGKA